MFEDLVDKIDFEREKYFTYLRLISREDFYTRAFEICVKEAIIERLMEDAKNKAFSENTESFFMQLDNLLDTIYLKSSQKKCIVIENNRITDESWNKMIQCSKF